MSKELDSSDTGYSEPLQAVSAERVATKEVVLAAVAECETHLGLRVLSQHVRARGLV